VTEAAEAWASGPAEPVAAPDPATEASLELVAGPADAPAIVFIHGTRMSRSYWTPQIEALSDEFRTIAVDLPGHGVRCHEAFTLDGAVAGIAAVIETRARGRAMVSVAISEESPDMRSRRSVPDRSVPWPAFWIQV